MATDALGAFDSPALRELAGENSRTRVELDSLATRAFRELGLSSITVADARLTVARSWAHKILSEAVSPYEGARAISRELCREPPHDEYLFTFMRLASEHEDFRFAQETAPGRYAAQIVSIEQAIQEAARALVQGAAEEVR